MLNRPVPALSQRPAHARGFTLIELMVTLAIIAILSAIAIPSYSRYLVRSKLTDATGGMVEFRLKMEQYYQDNRKYGTTGTTCGATRPVTATFEYTCATSASGQAFQITATSQTGKGLGSAAGHYVYTLNEANTKGTTMYSNAAQTGKTCWLLKGDEC
ncbi:MAG: type IV pilin protein [Telluria sp.]